MENFAEILEAELEQAFEVKNKASLHNYINLLVNNIVPKTELSSQLYEIKSDVRIIAETMKIGFEHVNKRFEDMNKRFDDMNKKISLLIWVMSLWMTLLTAISFIMKWYQ